MSMTDDQIATKTGRYGPQRKDCDYSPKRIQESVERSLSLLHTTYLDLVYLHDVEYVADLDERDLKVDSPAYRTMM